MAAIRERLEAHRKDVLMILHEASRTATLFEGFRLAGAVGHLARAQALLSEELEGLPRASKQETVSGESEPRNEDETPMEGIRPEWRRLPESGT